MKLQPIHRSSLARPVGLATLAAAVAVCAAAFGAGSTSTSTTTASTVSPAATPVPTARIPVGVAVSCVNPETLHPGSPDQSVNKWPIVTNSLGYTVPAGNTLEWKSSDGDSGSYPLGGPMHPGATYGGIKGKAGKTYTCTATMTVQGANKPDLTVKVRSVTPVSGIAADKIELDVTNLGHADVASAKVAITPSDCFGGVLPIASTTVSLKMAETKTVTLTASSAPILLKLNVAIDADKVLDESDEGNNSEAWTNCPSQQQPH